MFHSLLLTSIAVLGFGADEKPHERFGGDPAPKPEAQENAAAEQRVANLKEVIVDLNRQLAELKKQAQGLAEEKKKLETTLNDEKTRMQKRLVALENKCKLAISERDEMEVRLQIAEGKSRVLALARQEVLKRLEVLERTINSVRSGIKVAVDERNSLQKKLVNKTAEANARKVLFDRLAMAVRDKRYDDALKLVEEADEALKTVGETQKEPTVPSDGDKPGK
jgi:chromosome segregation ATPase